MANEDEDARTEFSIERAPYARILSLLREKAPERVDPAELASEIRKHGVAQMPNPVAGVLCDLLEGKISRRGRKGELPHERKSRARFVRLQYHAVQAVLQDDPEIPDEFVAVIEDLKRGLPSDLSQADAAWHLVSGLLYGHSGHHKKLRNLVSEHAPLKE